MGTETTKTRSMVWRAVLVLGIILAVVFSIFVASNAALSTRLYEQVLMESIEGKIVESRQEIDRRSGAMEQKALEIAATGSVIYQQVRKTPGIDLDATVKQYLTATISGFRDGIGGGLWYEPGVLSGRALYGPYVFWDKDAVAFTWDLNTPEYNYPEQSWYLFALPKDWDRSKPREKAIYWTPPYVDTAATNALMITADAFLYDAGGKIIGLATVDWSLEAMLETLSKTVIVNGSRQFLVDKNTDLILSDSGDKDARMKPSSTLAWFKAFAELTSNAVTKLDRVTVGGIDYRGFATTTKAGFVYGSLVPISEIQRPLSELFWVNFGASLAMAVAVLAAVFLLLTWMFRPLKPLLAALDQAAQGDLTVSLKPRGRDELAQLARHLNTLTEDWRSALGGVRGLLGNASESSEHLLGHSEQIRASLGALDAAMGKFSDQFDAFERELTSSMAESAEIDRHVDDELGQAARQNALVNETKQEWNAVLDVLTALRQQSQANERSMDDLNKKAQSSEEIVQKTVTSIREIAQAAETIGNMIGVINGVAAQTNLLAMNAAIEAAHAGDAGRGFSVVADEIRKLAETTGANSKQISQSLKTVIGTIRATEGDSRDTAEAIQDLVNGITAVSGTSEGISTGLEGLHHRGEQLRSSFGALEAATSAVTTSSQTIKSITAGMTSSFGRLSEGAVQNGKSVDLLIQELQVLGETANSLQQVAQRNRDQGRELEDGLSRFKT